MESLKASAALTTSLNNVCSSAVKTKSLKWPETADIAGNMWCISLPWKLQDAAVITTSGGCLINHKHQSVKYNSRAGLLWWNKRKAKNIRTTTSRHIWLVTHNIINCNLGTLILKGELATFII